MKVAHSKLTAQGQISVPAEIRKKLGIGPGSVLEWNEEDDQIVVRRSGRYSSEEVNRVVFPKRPPRQRPLAALKNGIRRYLRTKHARH